MNICDKSQVNLQFHVTVTAGANEVVDIKRLWAPFSVPKNVMLSCEVHVYHLRYLTFIF